VPVYSTDGGTGLRTNAPAQSSQPLFLARAAGSDLPGDFALTENGQPIGLVWKNPSTIAISELESITELMNQ
jgi:hypothetical protein